MRLRRAVPPLALLVLAGGAAVAAEQTEAGGGAATAAIPVTGPATPVLSARRLPAFLAGPAAQARLADDLGAIVAAAPPRTCLAVDAGTVPISAHNADLALTPASTQKLLVGAVALAELGPDHRFTTAVVAAAEPAGGTVDGDLWLVGGGDPVLATEPYAESSEVQGEHATRLEDLADAVVAAGITAITGGVIGDESRYDTERAVASWPERFVVPQNQTGPLSALSVNDGFTAFPTADDPAVARARAPDPAGLAAASLAFLLLERGVSVGAGPGSGRAPAGSVAVARIASAPLREIVATMNTYSDDQAAELLLKELGVSSGQEGSTAAGATALLAGLDRLGVATGGLVVADGSGLSPDNEVSCVHLRDVLAEHGPGSDLADSLAVAGETGTLADSFTSPDISGRLRAKTGQLTVEPGVRALAGFVGTVGADPLVFALLTNDDVLTEAMNALRDAVVETMARYPDAPALERLGP